MGIFTYLPDELLGTVESVDTSTVIIRVENDDKLRGLQVNHLISIQSSKVGQHLIGLVSKIIRKSAYSDSAADITPELGFNIIKVILIGTHFDRDGDKAAKILVIIVNDWDFIYKGQTMKIYLKNHWNMNVSPNELIEIIENPENLYHSDFVDWETVLCMMDIEIRNKIMKLCDPKNKVEFLKTYLQNASEDLYI